MSQQQPPPQPTIEEEDEQLLNSSKFAYFKADIVSVIQAFDKSREWADLIRCLQRFNKTIKKYPTVRLIPEKLSIAKRLSQCLNPALPSGVHLKTLESYQEIFSHIKERRLAKDVAIYASGLFPHYANASIQIKPMVLELFQKYFLPLQKGLLPCLSGLVISLLPGLEEEGSKVYKDTLKVLEDIKAVTDDKIFLRTIWKNILIAPQHRVCGFRYIQSYVQKNKQEASSVFGDCKSLAVEALVASLKDENLMVERGALELLSTYFKLDSGLFTPEENVALLSTAILLLTKRDMSLSRRVYQWVYGGTEFAENYFETNTKQILIDSYKTLFTINYTTGPAARQPLHALLTVVKKIPKEIALPVIEAIIVDLLKFLYRHIEKRDFSNELTTIISKLFAFIPQELIWNTLNMFVKETGVELVSETIIEMIDLVSSIFNILFSSEQPGHLVPQLLFNVLECLRIKVDTPDPQVIEIMLLLCINIFSKLDNGSESVSIYKIFQQYEDVYCAFIDSIILIMTKSEQIEERIKYNELFKSATTFLAMILSRSVESSQAGTPSITRKGSETMSLTDVLVPRFMESLYKCCLSEETNLSTFSIETFLSFLIKPDAALSARAQQKIITDKVYLKTITSKLWNMLVPSTASIHFEVTKLLVEIYTINKEVCSDVVSAAMLSTSIATRVEAHRRFALVWRLVDDSNIKNRVFDEALFQMLDAIKSDNSSIRLVGRSWLLSSMVTINRVLDPLFQSLLDEETLVISASQHGITSFFDEQRSKYVLGLWLTMLEVAPVRFIQRCMEIELSKETLATHQKYISRINNFNTGAESKFKLPSEHFSMPVKDYYSLLVFTCVKLMETGIYSDHKHHGEEHVEQQHLNDIALRETIRTNAAVFLRNLLVHGKGIPRTAEVAYNLAETVLAHLQIAVETYDAVFQFELLGLLFTILSHLDHISRTQSIKLPEIPVAEGAKEKKTPIAAVVGSPLFLPTLLQGVIVANQAQTSPAHHSFSLLHYWVDYVISFLPFLHASLPSFISAIVPHFCDAIRENAISGVDSLRSQSIQVMLDGLKHILHYCVLNSNFHAPVEIVPETTGSFAPFRLLTGLFTQETQIEVSTTPMHEAQNYILTELPIIVEAMVVVWKALRSPYKMKTEMKLRSSLGLLQFGSLQTKISVEKAITGFMDPLLAKFPSQLISSLIIVWANLHPEMSYSIESDEHELDSHVVDILNNLDSGTPESILGALTDVITSFKRPQEFSKRRGAHLKLLTSRIRDTVALNFVYFYLKKCIFTSNFPTMLQSLTSFMKELIPFYAQQSDGIYTLSLLLKIIHAFLMRYPHVENPKIKYQLKETTQMLIVALANASLKETQVARRAVVGRVASIGNDLAEQGTTTSASVSPMSAASPAQTSTINSTTVEPVKVMGGDLDPAAQALGLLSRILAEVLDKVFEEQEKAVIASIMPSLVGILKNHFIENIIRIRAVVELLLSLQQKKVLNVRSIRRDLIDLLMEYNFFQVDESALQTWRSLYKLLLADKEKAVLFELLAKFSTTQTIFTNRETEAKSRSTLLKRIAFLIFSGEVDEYQLFLNQILEKLTDSMRVTGHHNSVVGSVLLVLRVLIARVSSQHLSSFWPLILTELTRIFSEPESQDTQVLLEGVKFVDFATVVIPHEFQVYKWEFVSDPEDKIQETWKKSILFKPLLENFSKHAASAVNHQQFTNMLQVISQRSSSKTEERRPIRASKSSGFDLPSVAMLAVMLLTPERQQYLHNATSATCTYSQESTDRLLNLDMVELPQEDLDRIALINKQQAALQIERQVTFASPDLFLPSAPPPGTAPKEPESWIVLNVKPKQGSASNTQPHGTSVNSSQQ